MGCKKGEIDVHFESATVGGLAWGADGCRGPARPLHDLWFRVRKSPVGKPTPQASTMADGGYREWRRYAPSPDESYHETHAANPRRPLGLGLRPGLLARRRSDAQTHPQRGPASLQRPDRLLARHRHAAAGHQ